MNPISRILSAFLFVTALVGAATAQTAYSESTEYKPRPDAKSKKDRQNKPDKDKKTATVAPATDITVTVPVSFLDRSGMAVGAVKKDEVSVLVDGAEVPVVAFEQDKEPLNVIIVLDRSPSAELRFKFMQEQASKLASVLPAEMKIMVVDFNESMNVRSQLTTDRADTLKAISKTKMGPGTSIYSAIHTIYEKVLPQIPGRTIIVLMTDGVDTMSKNNTFATSLTEVEKNDVTIYPIYLDTFGDIALASRTDWIAQMLRNNPNSSAWKGTSEAEYKTGFFYLNDLAIASGGRMFSSEKLADGTNSFLSELANRYYITITLPRKNAGSRPVRVRVNRPAVAVFARGSFVEN